MLHKEPFAKQRGLLSCLLTKQDDRCQLFAQLKDGNNIFAKWRLEQKYTYCNAKRPARQAFSPQGKAY